MPSLTSAAVVAAVALLVPLVLNLAKVRVPEIVVQILFGILIGPQVLGWARVDEPVRVLSIVGLAFLLLLAGLEIDLTRLRGRVLRLTSAAFVLSFGLALIAGSVLGSAGLVRSPLLLAIILSATSLGIVVPVLEDAGQTGSAFGQVIVAAASIGEVVPIILLSLLFSEHSSGIASQVALLVVFVVFVGAVAGAVIGLERSQRLSRALISLQSTTAQIRVRAAFALLMAFAAIASAFGLEAILGAFLAGAALRLVDTDKTMTHTQFHAKLQGAGYGVFVPFFFISTGMSLNVRSLSDSGTLARIPVFLLALLVARGVPAFLYRPLAQGRRQLLAAGLLQATSLSIPVVAGAIGVNLGLIRPSNYVALVFAGLLSVVLFPLLALPRLGALSEAVSSPYQQDSDNAVEMLKTQ